MDDLVNAIIKCIETENIGGETYQLATGVETSVGDVVKILQSLSKKYLNYEIDLNYVDSRKGEVVTNWCDISKAERELKWTPQNDIETGLAKIFSWFYDTILI